MGDGSCRLGLGSAINELDRQPESVEPNLRAPAFVGPRLFRATGRQPCIMPKPSRVLMAIQRIVPVRPVLSKELARGRLVPVIELFSNSALRGIYVNSFTK